MERKKKETSSQLHKSTLNGKEERRSDRGRRGKVERGREHFGFGKKRSDYRS